MTIIFRIILIVFFGCIAFAIAGYYFIYKPAFTQTDPLPIQSIQKSSAEFLRLKAKASGIKKYIASNYYNSKICFLVDMEITSGKKRFFVYDLQGDSILISGLVAHGSCDNNFQVAAKFSNKANSGCSCMGKFKIGNKYTGKFGIAFKLFGLDSSNSNAYERAIVLHSYECVPDQETYPFPICNSRGCPMVSIKFLENLNSFITRSHKPILLDIYKGE